MRDRPSRSPSLITTWPGFAALCAALLAFACGARADADPGFCAVPLGDSPRRGAPDAPVKLVEFGDFECPYCGESVSTLAALHEARSGVVETVFKHAPSSRHPHALAAAAAAECAHQQGRFWEMHDQLYAHQTALGEAALVSYAEAVGLDMPSWQACRASDLPGERVAADVELAEAANLRATPTFFINGRVLVGALPLADFLSVVDQAEAEARGSGLTPDEYYTELTREPCR